MPISQGLKTSLNAIREISSDIYHRYVPIIDDTTDIGVFASPILQYTEVQNEFMNALINRIVYTSFETKYFRNPLEVLEGDRMPLGYAGQEIYVNPAKGRRFNQADFAGLLVKYDADIKVQYHSLNMDVQYPVTVNRQDLKKAFVSWGDLETFIDALSNSLYNGAFIDEYRFTKNIIAGAYKDNKAIMQEISAPTTEALAKQFIAKARTLFLNFQTPSTQYNAWNKMGGYGNAITTWTNPEDIVFIIRNDVRAYLDVEVLANSFNIDKATLLGNIISVDNFDSYDENAIKIFDGSKIVGMIADKSWFRIKRQDMFLDTFYNANNRTLQYYLNLIKMYNMSLFANGVIFTTELPVVNITALSYDKQSITVESGSHEGLEIQMTPVNGTTEITYEITDDSKATVTKLDNKHVRIDGLSAGNTTLTAKAGSVQTTISVVVE